MDAPRGPIVLMDAGDNIGAGSSADSTVLLAAAQRLGVRRYFQTLYDPEAVGACIEEGVGPTITLAVGGKTDELHGKPVTRDRRRCARSPMGKYEEPRPTHGGWRFFDGGIRAVLETTDGHTLVLTSQRTGNTSIEQMYSLGIAPGGLSGRRRQGRPVASPGLRADRRRDHPGQHARRRHLRPHHLHYQHRRRPLYPFEQDATYE